MYLRELDPHRRHPTRVRVSSSTRRPVARQGLSVPGGSARRRGWTHRPQHTASGDGEAREGDWAAADSCRPRAHQRRLCIQLQQLDRAITETRSRATRPPDKSKHYGLTSPRRRGHDPAHRNAAKKSRDPNGNRRCVVAARKAGARRADRHGKNARRARKRRCGRSSRNGQDRARLAWPTQNERRMTISAPKAAPEKTRAKPIGCSSTRVGMSAWTRTFSEKTYCAPKAYGAALVAWAGRQGTASRAG